MNIQKIKVDELKLSDIVSEFSKGKIRIPRFQRNYVWDRPRVVRLLNSIYNEFPIGTFFFWEAPGEYIHLYRNIPELNIPEPVGSSSFQFILDGQQRITSLYVAIKGLVLTIQDRRGVEKKIDYSEISFDLDKEQFVKKKPDNERFVSLDSILESDHMILFRSLSDERAKAFNKCYQVFSSYPLSVVYVRDQNLEKACIIFERINQGGVKLNLFDLVVASTWSNEFDLKEEVADFNKEFDQKGFGSLDPEVYLQTVSLLVKGQATREAQLQLKSDEIKDIWKTVQGSLELAVDYLRSNLGVATYDFIPYRAMIPMIAYFFAKVESRSLSPSQKKFIDEWFWKCTFSERYNVSTASLMGEDRRELFDQVLSGKDIKIDYPINVSPKQIQDTRMYRYSGLRNGLICLLAHLTPRHFVNNSVITLNRSTLSDFNSTERHHIFPRAYLKKIKNIYNENSMANFSFIPAELNLKISAKEPKQYFSEFKKQNKDFVNTLLTHLIPSGSDSAIWNNDYDKFLHERSELMLKSIEAVVGKITPIQDQLEKEPNQVLDAIEENLRAVIDDNLQVRFGTDYWTQAVGGDVQEQVKARITEHKGRYPDQRVQTNLERLSFCDMDDYRKIILNHWGLFEDEFTSRGEFERNFTYLRDYRNGLKHNRDITQIEKKHGDAAAEWFMLKILEVTSKGLENDDDNE